MTKRNISKYELIRRYIQDPFLKLYSVGFRRRWLEEKQEFKIFFQNVKVIEKRIKEKILAEHERIKQRRLGKKKFQPFYYRVDIIKLIPKKKKKTNYLRRLKIRHKLRLFATQMSVKQFNRKYLKRARKSSRMLQSFFLFFETRLDVIIYRMGLLKNAPEIRQLINHKNFYINNKIASIPGQQVNLFDFISAPSPIRFNFFTTFETFRGVFGELLYKAKKKDSLFFKMLNQRRRVEFKQGLINNKPKDRIFYFYYGHKRRRRKFRPLDRRQSLLFLYRREQLVKWLKLKRWRLRKNPLKKLSYKLRVSYRWSSRYFFDIIPFASVPSYLELNYRIFVCCLIKLPTFRNVFFPFRINKLRIPSLSFKF